MVGIFPRFSVGRAGHRRSQSAIEEREVMPPNPDVAATATSATATAHGIEVAVEFKPVEHPIEPLDNDRPIQCPLPEPSILNDGRIWKERVSASVRRRADLPPIMKDGGSLESEATGMKPRPTSNRLILPSLSAPEHDLLTLLEEWIDRKCRCSNQLLEMENLLVPLSPSNTSRIGGKEIVLSQLDPNPKASINTLAVLLCVREKLLRCCSDVDMF